MTEATSRTARSTLEERLDQEFPESWVPDKPGETISGTFLRLERGRTDYGPAQIAVIRTADGSERGVWLLHAVLKAEMKRLRPEPGERVAIRYEGRKKSAAGSTYAHYKVAADRDETPPDWGELDDEFDPRGEPAHAATSANGQGGDDIPF